MSDIDSENLTIQRHIEHRIRDALSDTRIVAVVGPRQAGKTTLANAIASSRNMRFLTLDDQQIRQFAQQDPVGFVRPLDRVVIDEVQRAPELLLALKQSVDENQKPGRFLLTGSVDLFRTAIAPDSLAGRVETFSLFPFSQSERSGKQPSLFLNRAFNNDFTHLESTEPTEDLIDRIFIGGFPEAQNRKKFERREAWFSAYIESLLNRDTHDLQTIHKELELKQLIRHAAVNTAQVINLTAMASHLSVDTKSVDRWLQLLEHLFILRRVPAWHNNELKRLTKSPKLHFIDTGILTSLRELSPSFLLQNRTLLGSLLETFVYTELMKQATIDNKSTKISHFRDRDKHEIDFILEKGSSLVGVEVKAAASVQPKDFKALERLELAIGERFVCGIVLYNGDKIFRKGNKQVAVPISQLWQ